MFSRHLQIASADKGCFFVFHVLFQTFLLHQENEVFLQQYVASTSVATEKPQKEASEDLPLSSAKSGKVLD